MKTRQPKHSVNIPSRKSSNSAGLHSPYSLSALSGQKIQRSGLNTDYGEFKADEYKVAKVMGYDSQIEFFLRFTPGKKADAEKIGLVQIVKATDDAGTQFLDPASSQRAADGWAVDTNAKSRNPIYFTHHERPPKQNQNDLGSWPDWKLKKLKPKVAKQAGDRYMGLGQYGHRYQKGGTWQSQDAELYDSPTFFNRSNNYQLLFETAAIAVAGRQKGRWYGSVTWGGKRDKKGKFTIFPMKLGGKNLPSKQFLKTAKKWNESKTMGSLEITKKTPVSAQGTRQHPQK